MPRACTDVKTARSLGWVEEDWPILPEVERRAGPSDEILSTWWTHGEGLH